MANVTNQTPLILDTVANNIVTGQLFIAKIRWVIASGGVAGDTATITDGNGKIIWTSASGATGQYVETDTYPSPKPLYCAGDSVAGTGLCVTALAHGKLYIYPA